ncbi:uncharacterized protein [Temnothorax nylanderi]|uniref:uncharacterized protein n=1 Tax=Temnothorax nylanderi TaxID=102681 RepID=UPI003A86E434
MDKKRKRFSYYSQRHIRRLVAKNTAIDLDAISEPTPGCSYHISSADENSPELISQNQNDSTNTIPKSSTDSDDSDDDNLCNNFVESDIVNNIDSAGEFDNVGSPREVEDSQSENEIEEFELESEFADEIDNQNLENYDKFKTDLCYWYINDRVSHKTLANLLVILRKHTGLPFPKDPRTLLNTPRNIECIPVEMQYYHFGFEKALKKMLRDYVQQVGPTNILRVFINIDGLPIAKSSNASLWPILCSNSVTKLVYIVGAYYGEAKPANNNVFLQKFVDEATFLINNQLIHDGQKIEIKIHGFICDAPAKSFILNTKSHNGYNSCTKCTIQGKYINGRICFPSVNTDFVLRTDEDFINHKYNDYQTGETILNNIPNFKPVTGVPLDCMHLVWLGVVKKIILLWHDGPSSVKLSNHMKQMISEALINLRNTVPSEYNRRPRSLKDFRFWKATKFRQFLLYTGPVVLKNILRKNVYLNFLSLHVAMTILVSPILSRHTGNIDYTQSLLEYFVNTFSQIYGEQYISHNIHNLLHIFADVRKYGPVDEFSAFPFENHMTYIKTLIRKPDKPLQQLVKRYAEIEMLGLKASNPVNFYDHMRFKKSHKNGPVIDGYNVASQFKMFLCNSYSIHCDNQRNNCVLLENGNVVSVLNLQLVECEDTTKLIIGKKLKHIKNLYLLPCESNTFNIQIVIEEDRVREWPCEKI